MNLVIDIYTRHLCILLLVPTINGGGYVPLGIFKDRQSEIKFFDVLKSFLYVDIKNKIKN